MEMAVQIPPDVAQSAPACRPEDVEKRRRLHKTTRPQLLTRDALDGRTSAAKIFDRIVADIHADLGGRDQLSAIELALVEAFAGAAVTLDNLNTRLLLGEPINLSEHAQAVSAMVRVASRLGLQRRQRDVTPSLRELLQAEADAEADAEVAGEAEGATLGEQRAIPRHALARLLRPLGTILATRRRRHEC